MKAIRRTIALLFVLGLTAAAHVSPVGKEQASSGTMMPHPSHANGAALTYAEWQGAHHRRAVPGDQGAHRRFLGAESR